MNAKRNASTPHRRSIFHARLSDPPDALVWSQDLAGRRARVTAIGSNRLLVENHTGLMELTDCRVRLNTGCGPLTVLGRDLSLCEARQNALIIRGSILNIELPCEGSDGDA